MKLRRLIPQRTGDGNWPFFLRHGIARLMNSTVELSSFGKMTTDWTMTAVEMAEKQLELRRFLEICSAQKPYQSWRRTKQEKAELLCGAVVGLGDGLVEVLTLGHLTTEWSITWMCYGEEIVEWCADRAGVPR